MKILGPALLFAILTSWIALTSKPAPRQLTDAELQKVDGGRDTGICLACIGGFWYIDPQTGIATCQGGYVEYFLCLSGPS